MKSTAWLAAHLRKRTPKPVIPDHAAGHPADRTPQPDPARRYSAFIAP
ncbi:hypothetical protein ABH920_006602 [Catenulispora sp. EB89]